MRTGITGARGRRIRGKNKNKKKIAQAVTGARGRTTTGKTREKRKKDNSRRHNRGEREKDKSAEGKRGVAAGAVGAWGGCQRQRPLLRNEEAEDQPPPRA